MHPQEKQWEPRGMGATGATASAGTVHAVASPAQKSGGPNKFSLLFSSEKLQCIHAWNHWNPLSRLLNLFRLLGVLLSVSNLT